MTYELLVNDNVKREFSKIYKKDRTKYEQIMKKLGHIGDNPYIGKPLKSIMAGKWRVHFGEYVMTYEINETTKTVKIIDYDHHDNVYE